MHVSKCICSLVLFAAVFGAEPLVAQQLKVLDKPLWIFPGQTFRIAIQQPSGAGKLDVNSPPTVEMFDTWPKDSIHRFYFQALRPGDATLNFRGEAGSLRIPLEVTRWSDVFNRSEFNSIVLPRIWPVGEADYRDLKRRRTFYSEEELSAKRRSNASVGRIAKQWLGTSDDEIFEIIPGPSVPRTCLIVLSGSGREDGRGKGCPKCGMEFD